MQSIIFQLITLVTLIYLVIGACYMVNKDKTGADRQSRLRASRVKWLDENAYGLSAEGLIGALMRGECSLQWASQQSMHPTRESLAQKSSSPKLKGLQNPRAGNAVR
jgi:hypothetical protein